MYMHIYICIHLACFSIQTNRSKQDHPHHPTLVRILKSLSSDWARVNRLRASAHLRCCKAIRRLVGLDMEGAMAGRIPWSMSQILTDPKNKTVDLFVNSGISLLQTCTNIRL